MKETSTGTIKGPFADLTNDVAFKWVFGREETRDLLTALLNELIPDREITDVTLFKESQLPYSKEFKKGVFDISCRNGFALRMECVPIYFSADKMAKIKTMAEIMARNFEPEVQKDIPQEMLVRPKECFGFEDYRD